LSQHAHRYLVNPIFLLDERYGATGNHDEDRLNHFTPTENRVGSAADKNAFIHIVVEDATEFAEIVFAESSGDRFRGSVD